jgi:hypothetical protein
MIDLTEIKYIKRITVGTDSPTRMRTPEEIETAVSMLNRCLNDSPKGSIIAVEKSFAVLQMGEHQVVLQWIVYHVGFTRKPFWLED